VTEADLLRNPKFSRSLIRGLQIYELFTSDPSEPRTVSGVARRLSMSQSTTHRYLSTLVAVDRLTQDGVRPRYRLVEPMAS
jgi:DNA-binding IclR family transcriptional regulator